MHQCVDHTLIRVIVLVRLVPTHFASCVAIIIIIFQLYADDTLRIEAINLSLCIWIVRRNAYVSEQY